MVYFGSLKRQSFINWADHFAGAAVVTEKLVNVNLVVLVRKVQRSGYGANVQAVSAPFWALLLVNGNFAFHELPHFDDAWTAFELADSTGWAVLFLDVKVDLHAFLLTRR